MNKKIIFASVVAAAFVLVAAPVFAAQEKQEKKIENVKERTRKAITISKTHIMIAANRIIKIADSLSLVSGKLQARVTELQASGKDVASLKAALADMDAKIADAVIQAKSASSTIASLVSNNEDNSVFQANKKIIADAHEKIKAGNKDLIIARKDGETVRKALSISKPKVTTASTTPATTTPATTTPAGNGGTLSQ